MGRNPLDWMSRMLEVPSNAKFKKKKSFCLPSETYMYIYKYLYIHIW